MQDVFLYTLSNSNRMVVKIFNYGAIVKSICSLTAGVTRPMSLPGFW